jgi:tight adherence protein B
MDAALITCLTLGSLLAASGALMAATRGAAFERLGLQRRPRPGTDHGHRPGGDGLALVLRRPRSLAAFLGSVAAFGGWHLAGPPGAVILAGAGVGIPLGVAGRSDRRRRELNESQLVDLAEALASGLRGGLSIQHALDEAAREIPHPLGGLLSSLVEEHRLGVPFEAILAKLATAAATDDARILALVVGLHARSGGDLAAAIEDVLSTMRHRLAVRRELRGLTAQGRLSGAILALVPLVFFLFLAITSRRELAPVYRSTSGLVMVGGGLGLEALAFVWIRRLLRVEM